MKRTVLRDSVKRLLLCGHTISRMTLSRPCSSRSTQPETSSLPYKGLLLDAAGTLLSPSEPIVDVYSRFALQHGVEVDRGRILDAFRR